MAAGPASKNAGSKAAGCARDRLCRAENPRMIALSPKRLGGLNRILPSQLCPASLGENSHDLYPSGWNEPEKFRDCLPCLGRVSPLKGVTDPESIRSARNRATSGCSSRRCATVVTKQRLGERRPTAQLRALLIEEAARSVFAAGNCKLTSSTDRDVESTTSTPQTRFDPPGPDYRRTPGSSGFGAISGSMDHSRFTDYPPTVPRPGSVEDQRGHIFHQTLRKREGTEWAPENQVSRGHRSLQPAARLVVMQL